MHVKPMAEHDGTFNPSKKLYPCPKCHKETLECRIWESSCGGYEDYKYDCRSCGHSYWVDGIDS